LGLEYRFFSCRPRRGKLILFSLVLSGGMSVSLIPTPAAWAASAPPGLEYTLAVAVCCGFAVAALVLAVYAFVTLEVIFGWVEGFVRLCRHASADCGPHEIGAAAADAVRAYRQLDVSLGPIGFFCLAYGQVLSIIQLYRAIGGLVVAPLGGNVEDLAAYYLMLACYAGVAADITCLNMMLADASQEAHEALRQLVEPLEVARTKLGAEEGVSGALC
jgi:hypothetical protein